MEMTTVGQSLQDVNFSVPCRGAFGPIQWILGAPMRKKHRPHGTARPQMSSVCFLSDDPIAGAVFWSEEPSYVFEFFLELNCSEYSYRSCLVFGQSHMSNRF